MQNNSAEKTLPTGKIERIQVFHGHTKSITYHGHTFAEAVTKLLGKDSYYANHATKLKFPELEISVMFERNLYKLFELGDLSDQEFFDKTNCDDLCRNQIEIYSTADNDVSIDSGSLWLKRGNDLILVDDDRFITTQFDDQIFSII